MERTMHFVLCLALFMTTGMAVLTNPIQKAMEMLSDLEQKIIRQGAESQKVYGEFADMCADRSREMLAEIKHAKQTVEDLLAAIEAATDDTTAAGTKIEELSSAIATDEADLKAAGLLREKETSDFGAEERNLLDTIDTLQRAITILEKEMQAGASFTQVQVRSVNQLSQVFSVMVGASALNLEDASRLTALVQTVSDSDDGGDDSDDFDEDAMMGPPAGAAYKKRSGSIIETMDGLLEKAQTKLEEIRQVESKSIGAYQLFKQSLEDKLRYAKRDMDDAKKRAAEAGEKKATAEGDLSVTKKDLLDDQEVREELRHICMEKAADFQEQTKSRGEELDALAKAKKIIRESMGESALQTDHTRLDGGDVSFVQIRAHTSGGPSLQAMKVVRLLAHTQRSRALMQLASRMDAAIRADDDPFANVKGMLKDMLAKLSREADADATKKAYCDREMTQTRAKKTDKEEDIEKLSTTMDQMAAKSAKLKEALAVLSKELSEIGKAQREIERVRQEEKSIYERERPEIEQGIDGIQKALKILRDYYSKPEDTVHESGSGAASGIISLLEVAESDLSKQLSDMIGAEENAVKAYKEQTQENTIAKQVKDQDIKFKTKEAKSLDKASSESSADRDGVQEELDAINEYFAKINEACVAKPSSYEERKKRRDQEIAGLKEALETLGGATSLLQESLVSYRLRGSTER